jgi:protein-tyrosine phosphatase
MQRRILFVCTGNIFRSLTAEYALRAALRGADRIVVESAGTEDYPHVVKPVVRDYLLAKGIDVRGHRRRTVSAAMLAPPTLIIAMSTEHRAVLRDQFGVIDAPLFMSACGYAEEPLPDVEEAVVDHTTNAAAADAHVRATIDRIIAATPRLAERLVTGMLVR